MIKLIKYLATAALIVGTPLAALSATLKYAGSDFLAGNVEKSLRKQIKDFSAGEEPSGEFLGSKIAVEKLRKGEVNFSIVMLPEIDSIQEIHKKEWRAVPIGYQVTYVIVPRSNPITEISFAELESIFAEFARQPFVSWSEIGQTKNMNVTIRPLIGSVNNSNAVTFFQTKVFPKSDFRRKVTSIQTDEEAIREVREFSDAIAIIGVSVEGNPYVKPLSVSGTITGGPTLTAYPPIPANIYNNDYPLSLPIYLIYPIEERSALKPVFQTVFSEKFSKSLADGGFTPIPENIRENYKKSIDKIGK